MYRDDLLPPLFPAPWASDWGEDRYGLWMAFTLGEVRQPFRWCELGTFMMGSPEDEPERLGDWETRHEVTLSKGFWLADTAVTQALWQAVMNENPSRFKGAERPVEQVSWDDAQQFIEKLNELVPGLEVRLPWEAEWEYACRAGTTSPFSFGENINTDQVNYDGNRPYNQGKKGNYREETVEVKSLPCNAWGLYEMHGNVLEWCRDFWQEDLGADPTTDPRGPETGDYRVVRGGSWNFNGWFVRSAFRYLNHPSNRDDDQGFRLAQGH